MSIITSTPHPPPLAIPPHSGELVQLPDDCEPILDDPQSAALLLAHKDTRILLALFHQSPRGRHHSSVRVIDKIRML